MTRSVVALIVKPSRPISNTEAMRTLLILLAAIATYTNPIVYADYSDPDVIRVDSVFYMTASSFNCSPGLQILSSSDLVHWQIVDAALPHAIPGGAPVRSDGQTYGGSMGGGSSVQHGNQVWAPSIRYHNDQFWIVWGDPDRGVYQVHGQLGAWSEPVLFYPGKGLIDACPLWDEDGHTYLVHAYAGSRAGMKSLLAVAEVDEQLTHVVRASQIVFDGHGEHPTCEGPKFYRRDGYYYILCPAGGVSTGWQLAMRSLSPYGPYEEKVVLRQGATDINAPHQGGLVSDTEGAEWFLHFQDVGPLGRILHLQPVTWEDGWPIMGDHGEPVTKYAMPMGKPNPRADQYELSGVPNPLTDLGWQWQATPDARWFFVDERARCLRLYSHPETFADGSLGEGSNLWNMRNLLLRKPVGLEAEMTVRVQFHPDDRYVGERAGLVMMGTSYAALLLEKTSDGIVLRQVENSRARQQGEETIHATLPADEGVYYLRVHYRTLPPTQRAENQMSGSGTSTDRVVIADFSFSRDGRRFQSIGAPFHVQTGLWIGAKWGLFCTRPGRPTNDGGWLDVYDCRIQR